MARSELNTLLPLYCSLSSRHRLIFFKGRLRGTCEGERRCPLLSSPRARVLEVSLFAPKPATQATVLPHLRESKAVLVSGFHAMDSGLFVSGTWIPDFFQLHSGSHTKNLPHSAFHKKEFPGFRDPDSLTAGAICNYF